MVQYCGPLLNRFSILIVAIFEIYTPKLLRNNTLPFSQVQYWMSVLPSYSVNSQRAPPLPMRFEFQKFHLQDKLFGWYLSIPNKTVWYRKVKNKAQSYQIGVSCVPRSNNSCIFDCIFDLYFQGYLGLLFTYNLSAARKLNFPSNGRGKFLESDMRWVSECYLSQQPTTFQISPF